jgi:hypothetical protein
MKPRAMSGVWLLDESAGLLRALPASAWTVWLATTLPFVWGLLDFIEQLARSAFAAELLLPKSLALVVLYWVKNLGQAHFVRECEALLRGERRPATVRDWLRTALVQAAVQPWRFLLLPAASLLVVPLPWLAGFFRYAGAAALEHPSGILRTAWNAGRGHARAQAVAMSMLLLFWILLYVNFAALWFLLPFLAKAFFGWETEFLRLAARLINLATLLVTAVLATFALEPLQNAMAAVRAFYLRAESGAGDLFSLLRRTAAAALLFAFLVPSAAIAQPAEPRLDEQQLESRIEQVLRQPEFAWRMPKQESESNSGWLEALARGLEQAIEFLRKMYLALFGEDDPADGRDGSGWSLSAGQLQSLMGIAGVLIVAMAIMLLWNSRRRGPAPHAAAAGTAAAITDLADEAVTPQMRPEHEWLRAAEEMFARGEHRLAIRALHLAGLRHLGERGWITLAPAKTGHEYGAELARRLRDLPEARARYAHGLRAYEEVWYGFAAPSAELFAGVREQWNSLRGIGAGHV